MFLAVGLGKDANSIAIAVSLEIALDRDHHEIVLRLAEHAAQRLSHADHFVRLALHLDHLAQRIAPLEEADTDIVADERYGRVPPYLFIGNTAAQIDLYVVD